MTDVSRLFFVLVRACLLPHATLAAENLALRQQLIVLHRSVKRPKLRNRDRIFWILLSRLWKQWQLKGLFNGDAVLFSVVFCNDLFEMLLEIGA